MRGLRILLFVVIPLSFVFGLVWGWKVRQEREARGVAEKAVKTVRVLTLAHLVPESAVREFEGANPIHVEIEEAATPPDLMAKWTDEKTKGQEPDLVTLLYSQIPDTSKALKLQPLDLKKIPHFKTISPDFIDWPGSHEWPTTAPIAWGFDGWALTKASKGQKSLWVATLAMTAGCSKPDAAFAVVDALLTQTASVERARTTGFGSTSTETETSTDLDPKLKPRALRETPLTDYVIDRVIPHTEVKEQERE